MNENGLKYYEYLKSKGLDVPPTYESFQNTLNDPNQASKYYKYLQSKKSQDSSLDLPPNFDSFYNTLKKKDQSEIGSQATQPTDGSESVQSFQGIGKAIEKNLGVKPKSDADIQAPLTEQGVKELEYRQRIKEDKDKYKIASDEQVDEAIRRNPEIVNSDKFYEGAVPEIEGIPTTLFGGNTKLESAQKQRDYYENWDPDFESAPKQTDLFSDEDVKADPKKYKDAALNDYLEYLKVKNGEDSQTYLGAKEKVEYYKSLGDKLYNDESYADDLKRFQDIQKTALSKIGNNAYAKALKIENSYDWDYFSKKASDLQLKADLIDKQIKELGVTEGKVLSSSQQKKLNDLINQYGNIQQEFSKLSEDTRIDNNVISEMSNIQNKMSKVQKSIIDIEDEDTVNAKIIKQYKEELEANKKAQEEFYNTKDSGVLETAGKGVAMFGQKAASSFVDGIFSLYNVPKIAGEALGAKGYGWTDKISEASENINSFVDLYSPQLESGNLTNFMSAMQSLGEGVGSVATFFTAGASVSRIGKALNLSQKSLNVANKAGQFAVASSLSTSQMYTEFLQNGFTPEEASRYALGAGIVMGMAEMIVPEDELIANELKGTFLSSIKSGATTKEAIENGLQFIGKKSALFAENMRKEGTEEFVGKLAESASKQVSEAGTGKKIDGIWNVDDFTKAALGGAGTAGIIEIFKFGSETGEFSNPFKENMVGYLAENYNDMIKKLSESNPEAYDQIADRYGKLKEIYSGLKNIPAYNELSKADQDHVLAQAHTKQVILENIKQSGLDKANFKDQLDAIEEDIFLTLNKPKQDAVQERSTEEVLPSQQRETTETGGQPQGMGQGVQGEEVTQETEAQRQERIAKEAAAGAAEVVTGLNIPNALAASVFPVVGEVEAQMEKGEFVNDEKSTEAQDKLYELLADIDSREDLTPEQKQQMSAVIENRIQKIQDYDYRTRTETRTTTQTVATGVSPKTQKQNERAAIPVRTVAEEGVDVTYDGRRGKVELRDGQYVFIPAKTGAVQGRPVVIGEAAQINAGSRFAGVENPTKGPNAVVANITLPNGSTLSVLNDDLSVDIGLEIAKQEVGLAPQALFDTVFDEVVTENKVEVPYLRETKPAQEQAATTEQVTEQATPQVTPQVTPQAQETEQEVAPEEEAKVVEEASKNEGIKPKNMQDLIGIYRKVFGLSFPKAVSAAMVSNRLIKQMAKRAGVTTEQMYQKLSFQKANEKDLPQGVKMQVDAWHGSPYEFDKFTTEKMGTGEGRQAFGWGLYFTDLKGIAEAYARKLSGDKFSYDGKDISENAFNYLSLADDPLLDIEWNESRIKELSKIAIEKINKEYIPDFQEIQKTSLSEKQRQEMPAKIEEAQRAIKELEDIIKSNNITKAKNKNLYKVSLHKNKTPEQYTWFEWDKKPNENVVNKIKQGIKNKNYEGKLDLLNDEFKKLHSKSGGQIEEKTKHIKTQNNHQGLRFVLENWSKSPSFNDVIKELSESEISDLKRMHDIYVETNKIRNFGLDIDIYDDWIRDNRGGDVYYFLSKFLGGPKEASLFLLENGIDGVKFPAESISRGATSETARGFNYVVFDENAVSIEEVIKFQKDAEKARGAMMIGMDGQAIIYALTDPNISTPLHELAHVFEHYLTDAEKNQIIKAAKTNGWTTETSEYFARGFEKYLAEGKSNNPIFEKFKQFLLDVYKAIKGSPIDVKLNKQMKAIYAEMLGEDITQGEVEEEVEVETDTELESIINEFKAAQQMEGIDKLDKMNELKEKYGEIYEKMTFIDSNFDELLDKFKAVRICNFEP